MRAIEARFTDKPVKLDDAKERRVSTALKMIYEGGSLDGKTANFPTRDLSSVVVGVHRTAVVGFNSEAGPAKDCSPIANIDRARSACANVPRNPWR